ncbi:MAG: hypothetical protein ACE5FE_01070 [Acidiferrobacterales bacterium]
MRDPYVPLASREVATCGWLVVAISLLLMVGCEHSTAAHPQLQRIQVKAERAKQGVIERAQSGRDVSRMVRLMEQVEPSLRAGKFTKAETLLDTVLQMLSELNAGHVGLDEPLTHEFGDPKRVAIIGYHGDAMDPVMSRDGSYLFFNNLNDPRVNTDLYYAKKIDALTFKFAGELKGTNTQALEGVPTMDRRNRFCFVSTREYERTLSTLFCGVFDGGKVRDVHQVGETLSRKRAPWFNMDVELSADGNTLYYTENEWDSAAGFPKSSNMHVALRENGRFKRASNSRSLMKNINTDELEYAASISNDGLELYFTRAGVSIADNNVVGARFRVLVAKRDRADEPFGLPHVIGSIVGFVEAPTLTADSTALYYHQRDGERFHIYRVVKKK